MDKFEIDLYPLLFWYNYFSMFEGFIKKIVLISRLCWDDWRFRHLLFLVSTVLVVILYGYYFGTFDQASHIPFLKKSVDPTLYPNDHFFDLRSTHYSFFWLFFAPMIKIHFLEISMFVVHLLVTYLTFWAIWSLSITLFKNPLTSFITTIAFIFPHIGFSGFPLFEFSLLNRTFALPFELFALNYYLKKQELRTFFILGLIYNIHVISVNFFMVMICFDVLLRIRKYGLFFLVKTIALFILGALPVLVWKFGNSGIDIRVHYEWFDLLNRSTFFHLFNFISLKNIQVIFISLNGIASLCLFFIFSRGLHEEKHQVSRNFIYAGICVLLVQFISTYAFPSTIIIQSQISRIGILISSFSYFYVAYYVASLFRKSTENKAIVMFAALIFTLLPTLFLITYCFENKITSKYLAYVATGIITIFFSTILITIYSVNLWSPGFYIYPRQSTFTEMQIWARDNTPKNAIFITPPEKWWMYETEWRVLSERSSVSTISELLEAAFDPTYISYWRPRFEAVAPGAIKQFDGNPFANLNITKNAYNSLHKEDIMNISHAYNASYVLVEKPTRYRLPIAYQNEEYIMYKIK